MDTMLVVLLVFLNLNLYLKIPRLMTPIFISFMYINVVL